MELMKQQSLDKSASGQRDEDIDTEDEMLSSPTMAPQKKVTQRRQQDFDNFDTFVADTQRDLARRAKDTASITPDHSSLAYLAASGTGNTIIHKPREYQLELFERAKTKNTIVVLDTGSGKTLIAALLLRHTLEREVEHRAEGKPGKIAFFLVEKVALCWQQYEVLSKNLPFPMTKLFGDMASQLRTAADWAALFSENMLVVCTAQILLDCFHSGYISMSRINLLVFDEAHHTKKNHPYATIVKHHYLRAKREDQPRILGMTASPADSNAVDPRTAATDLEVMLHSEIATISDEVLSQQHACRQLVETKEVYTRLENPAISCTPLWRQMQELLSRQSAFGQALRFTKEASSSLGTWCADRLWHLYLTGKDSESLVKRAEADVLRRSLSVEAGDLAVEEIHAARDAVQRHALGVICADSLSLSSKVNTLRQVLVDAFSKLKQPRVIVFVKKRYTSLLLVDLFQQKNVQISGMRPGYLTGCNASPDLATMSPRDQFLSLRKFRDGLTNCLFATPVAEEGIDIPECDLVIRFDIHDSEIQYVQSRGRARQVHSRFINMVEEGNIGDSQRLIQASLNATALRRFCAALPADRKLEDTSAEALAALQHLSIGAKTLEVAETGAQLTFRSSLDVLARFVSSLSTQRSQASMDCLITSYGKSFVAELVFSDSCPIKTASGQPQRSKLLARCSASYEACVQLFDMELIDKNLRPVFAKRLPTMRNARLAINPKKKSEYSMKMKPAMWQSRGRTAELSVTIIALRQETLEGSDTKPLLLLTREKLPKLPDINLFVGNGESAVVTLRSLELTLSPDDRTLGLFKAFTLKLFSDVFSKEFDGCLEHMPYFFAPAADVDAATYDAMINWSALDLVKENEQLDWNNQKPDFFIDKLVVDPCDGGRKFVTRGINTELRPSDPVPDYAPLPRSRAYRKVQPIIKEYSNSLTPTPRENALWRESQPVVNAQILPMGRDLLDEARLNDPVPKRRCAIILEPLRVSPLPIGAVWMALTLPAVMLRIESHLITLEACSVLGLDIKPELALEAMTRDGDVAQDSQTEAIELQRGMGKNYERLEFLGDTFLKMATTISLFTTRPDNDEFGCHVERMCMIANKNLFNHMKSRHIEEYIRTKAFDRRAWYPAMKLLKGKALKGRVTQRLADKTIADVAEALIGAAYIGADKGNMDMAVRAVTAMVQSDKHRCNSFSDYFAAYDAPAWQSAPASALQVRTVKWAEERLGYRFRSPALLRSAFKHPSYPYEAIPHYQRLEFLGDSLLDLAIVDHLFRNFPTRDPQWLTEHKGNMVSNKFLGYLSVKLGLQKHALLTTSSLLSQITDYVTEVENAEEEGGLGTRADLWTRVSDPPKALADMVEALVGAMFVDSSYDYAVVDKFFLDFVLPSFRDMNMYDTYAGANAITEITHLFQQDLGCEYWRMCVSEVPGPLDGGMQVLTETEVLAALLIHGEIAVHHTAGSGRQAKLGVAKAALDTFEGMQREEWAAKYGCDCGRVDGRGHSE